MLKNLNKFKLFVNILDKLPSKNPFVVNIDSIRSLKISEIIQEII